MVTWSCCYLAGMDVSKLTSLLFVAGFWLFSAQALERSKRNIEAIACNPGYRLHQEHCYKLFTATKSFSDAETECIKLGGHLASIPNQTKHDWLVQTFLGSNDKVFIGYTDRVKEGTWTWLDNSVSTFQQWGFYSDRQLPDIDRTYNCAVVTSLTTVRGAWMDWRCEDRLPYICAVDRKKYYCPRWMTIHQDRCYKLVKGRKNWLDAKANCQKMGTSLGKQGHLATIPDASTQQFIETKIMPGRRWAPWISLNDRDNENQFVWSRPSVGLNYTNWAVFKGVQQPSGGTVKNCVAIEGVIRDLFGKWNDFKCRMKTWSICEVQASEIVVP